VLRLVVNGYLALDIFTVLVSNLNVCPCRAVRVP
jgi:hypothetical protein